MRRTLDTNICSYILRSHPAGMIARFATLDREQRKQAIVKPVELRGARIHDDGHVFGGSAHNHSRIVSARPGPMLTIESFAPVSSDIFLT